MYICILLRRSFKETYQGIQYIYKYSYYRIKLHVVTLTYIASFFQKSLSKYSHKWSLLSQNKLSSTILLCH